MCWRSVSDSQEGAGVWGEGVAEDCNESRKNSETRDRTGLDFAHMPLKPLLLCMHIRIQYPSNRYCTIFTCRASLSASL